MQEEKDPKMFQDTKDTKDISDTESSNPQEGSMVEGQDELVQTDETEAKASTLPSPPLEQGSLVGKVFVGIYLLIYGWFLLHTLLYFWDILIPWNISWLSHFYFNGAFMLFILLLCCVVGSLWCIWRYPSLSDYNAIRWPLEKPLGFIPYLFWLSNMAGEPFSVIGSSWIGADLRYPEFLSQPYFFFIHMAFVTDMAMCFNSDDDSKSKTFLFRPFRNRSIGDFYHNMYRENLSGILACGYIYFSYLFIIMAVSRSWIERILMCVGVFASRSCFARGKDFEGYKMMFFVSFVPILACVRLYYAYYEWSALGSTLAYLMNLTWFFSQIIIFAGWYSHPESVLAKLFVPFPPILYDEADKEE